MFPTETRVFRPPNIKRNMILGMGLYSVIGIGAYIYGVSDRQVDALILAMGAFVIGIITLTGAWFMWMMSKIRLIISPDGIEHQRPFISLYCYWGDIQRIGDFTYSSKNRSYTDTGLYAKNKTTKMHIYTHFIPLSHFAPNGDWEHHEIGDLVRQYAPHVFKQNDTSSHLRST